MKEIYEEAACEWIARQIRARGHRDFKRGMVRKPEFGIDRGWPGSDVTPPDDPEAAVMCEIKGSTGWHEHGEHVYSVSTFLRECSEIVRELDTQSTEGQLRSDLKSEQAARAEAERAANSSAATMPENGTTKSLIEAVSRRVGWAREALANDDFTDMEKNWMRRYEMDVPALLDEIERQRSAIDRVRNEAPDYIKALVRNA